ncbi:MAG TPA: HAMP domain-containing sensor histidine kinase, partial [Anaerolineae bacterium]|nr:HAMP domain-containing sensor histidine kinase [Anaerolineae bacterium]
LERIASQAKDLLQPVDAVVYLLQPNGHTLQAVVAVGKYADEFREDTVEMGAGIIGHVAQAGIAEMVNKPSLDPRRIHITGSWDKEVGSDDDLYPLIVAPIVVQERVIGVIAIWRHVETGLFTSANLNFLNALSQQAAIAIQNARLFEAEQYQRQLAEQHSQELETANALLQATNAELDAFAHTVAHDLKNPLGIITSYSDFLFEVGSDMRPDELNLIFGELQKSGYKATNIIEELLLLASVRKGSIKLKPLDMTQIVEGAQRRIRLMIQEYQAEIIHPPNWPQAQGYGPWVEEVWVNYLSNGLKYGGEPPRLELGATPQADGMIRFWVRDNGPGLTPEARTKLFAEFTRLDEVRAEGHGLGLSIVRRIVEKLGGQVGVESEGVPGRGSTFYFTLPAV